MTMQRFDCRTTLIVAFISLCAGYSHAANRCIGSDGQVAFQDTPCAQNSKSSEPIRLRDNTVSNGLGRPAAPEKLEFGQDRTQNVIVASAALDLLATNGRDCRLELKVRPDSQQAADSCNRFLAQYREWWKTATREVGDAIKDERWWESNRHLTRKAADSAQIVSEAYAFITLHLKSTR